MKTVPVQEAVGMVLCHDITKIVPGEFKGRAYAKGHVIKEEDIEELLKIGKEHIYVWDLPVGCLHEDEAAERIARAARGSGIELTTPNQGKIELRAAFDGLLTVNKEVLAKVNSLEGVALATRRSNLAVARGQVVAGTRVIPLVIEEELIECVERFCRESRGILRVKPFRPLKVGLVTTGSEVFHGRIKDKFAPVIERKLEKFSSKIFRQINVTDDVQQISAAILELVAQGAEAVCVSGGMSVDPDDVTPTGIRNTSAEVITYGVPVLPGSMFMLAYLGSVPIMGLPGCVMYERTTIFDLVLPQIVAGERIERRDLVNLGYNGLCLACDDCRYPMCPFGSGA